MANDAVSPDMDDGVTTVRRGADRRSAARRIPLSALQLQARALGDPTRHRLFRYIADAGRPVDVADITERLGVHHNSVRQHLAKLVDAGLVYESTALSIGPGRPRLRYTIDASVESRWGVTGPYERLTLMLAEIVRTGDSPEDVGRRIGRLDRPPSDEAADPVATLAEKMARHGFQPAPERHGSQVEMSLNACPFETTALADPDTVCGLHLGLALGAAESLPGVVVDELVRRDPRQGACRLRCHIEA